MEDVVGHMSHMQVTILNATGRIVSKEVAEWFEAVQICMNWPDPRIWCNRIGALGGSSGAGVIESACAGAMAADSRSYGPQTLIECIKLISRAHKAAENGCSMEDFVYGEVKSSGGKPHLIGFARPIAKGDERIIVVEKLSKKLGLERGEHIKLAFEIESILHRDFGEAMNLSGYVGAFLSDYDYSALEAMRIFSVGVSSGIVACNVDYADRKGGSFSPLRVEDISYAGTPHRSVNSSL
jgi:citrate synthase